MSLSAEVLGSILVPQKQANTKVRKEFVRSCIDFMTYNSLTASVVLCRESLLFRTSVCEPCLSTSPPVRLLFFRVVRGVPA